MQSLLTLYTMRSLLLMRHDQYPESSYFNGSGLPFPENGVHWHSFTNILMRATVSGCESNQYSKSSHASGANNRFRIANLLEPPDGHFPPLSALDGLDYPAETRSVDRRAEQKVGLRHGVVVGQRDHDNRAITAFGDDNRIRILANPFHSLCKLFSCGGVINSFHDILLSSYENLVHYVVQDYNHWNKNLTIILKNAFDNADYAVYLKGVDVRVHKQQAGVVPSNGATPVEKTHTQFVGLRGGLRAGMTCCMSLTPASPFCISGVRAGKEGREINDLITRRSIMKQNNSALPCPESGANSTPNLTPNLTPKTAKVKPPPSPQYVPKLDKGQREAAYDSACRYSQKHNIAQIAKELGGFPEEGAK